MNYPQKPFKPLESPETLCNIIDNLRKHVRSLRKILWIPKLHQKTSMAILGASDTCLVKFWNSFLALLGIYCCWKFDYVFYCSDYACRLSVELNILNVVDFSEPCRSFFFNASFLCLIFLLTLCHIMHSSKISEKIL